MLKVETKKYTINDISEIINNGITYELTDDVMQIIKHLAEQVGAADYVRTPQFQRNGNRGKKKPRNTSASTEISNEDWEAIRNFQATEIAKKAGIDASIDKVRIYLNKITDSTFEKQKDAIFGEIENIIETTDSSNDNNNLDKISELLFNIASNNSFYSNLYAELYCVLIKKYEFIGHTLEHHLVKLDSLFCEFESCDPEKDYDKFCEINKSNESRRAASLFYVNLMKRNLIDQDRILELIHMLQGKLLKEMNLNDKISVVEELSELLSIIITNCWQPDKDWGQDDSTEWITTWSTRGTLIRENIDAIACEKAKNYPSLSNKTVFKHMDIRDALNKLTK